MPEQIWRLANGFFQHCIPDLGRLSANLAPPVSIPWRSWRNLGERLEESRLQWTLQSNRCHVLSLSLVKLR